MMKKKACLMQSTKTQQ